jgi:hypothetical protein
MSGQLSKTKETPLNQPSESEEVPRNIIANSLGSSNIEAELIQARFYIFEDCPYPLSQRAPDPQCSDGTVFESTHLEPSLGDHLPSNYGSLKPGETYKYGVFTVIKGVENNNPLGDETCRTYTVEGLSIAVDAEWDKDGNWLSTSFTTNVDGHFMRHFFVVDTLPTETLEQLRTMAFLSGDKFHAVNADENKHSFLPTVIADADPHRLHKTVTLLLFYSAKDLEFSLGWEFMEPLYLSDTDGVTQKRCLRGSFPLEVGDSTVSVELRDLKGIASGSLKSFAESLDLNTRDKGVMDAYKSDMRRGFIENPAAAYTYSRNDTDILHKIYIAFEQQIIWIENEVIGITPKRKEGDALKQTTGSLVANTFEKYLMSLSHDPEIQDFAFKKLGRLDTGHHDHDLHRKAHDIGRSIFKNREACKIWAYRGHLKNFLKAKYRITVLGQCSVGHFVSQDDTSTFNALVQGGRCNNERPSESTLDHGADIDLSSCYGTALRKFIYPIGLPTTWGYQSEQQDDRPSLGKWLSKNEKQLMDNLWTVTVTGNLTFLTMQGKGGLTKKPRMMIATTI